GQGDVWSEWRVQWDGRVLPAEPAVGYLGADRPGEPRGEGRVRGPADALRRRVLTDGAERRLPGLRGRAGGGRGIPGLDGPVPVVPARVRRGRPGAGAATRVPAAPPGSPRRRPRPDRRRPRLGRWPGLLAAWLRNAPGGVRGNRGGHRGGPRDVDRREPGPGEAGPERPEPGGVDPQRRDHRGGVGRRGGVPPADRARGPQDGP